MIKNKRHIFVAALLTFSFMAPSFASAANLTRASVRLGRLSTGASTADNNDLFVSFKLNTNATNITKIKVTFPATFTTIAGTPTVSTTSTVTPATTAPPGTLTAAVTTNGANAGGDVTLSGITGANATTLYGFGIPTGSLTNPASAGQYNVIVSSISGTSTVEDTTTTPVYIYGAGANKDQVVVSASVAPNFSFQLSANADTIPQVDPSVVQSSPGVTMTVGTNSPFGYTAFVKSKNAALNSAVSTGSIPTGTYNPGPTGAVNTVTPGTTFYGFVPYTGTACSSCTGSLSYDPTYSESGSGGAYIASATTNSSATSQKAGAFNSTNFSSFVSRSGYTNGDLIILKERVAVANTIPYANDYTDTLTIVAAGNF